MKMGYFKEHLKGILLELELESEPCLVCRGLFKNSKNDLAIFQNKAQINIAAFNVNFFK